MRVYNLIYPCFLILGMEDRWEERFETSMKEYLDNIESEVKQDMADGYDGSTDEEYCQQLAELVEAKFNKSVEVVLACMKKAVMTNDNRIHAVDIQNFQVV